MTNPALQTDLSLQLDSTPQCCHTSRTAWKTSVTHNLSLSEGSTESWAFMGYAKCCSAENWNLSMQTSWDGSTHICLLTHKKLWLVSELMKKSAKPSQNNPTTPLQKRRHCDPDTQPVQGLCKAYNSLTTRFTSLWQQCASVCFQEHSPHHKQTRAA